MSRGRRLSPEERELWGRVARTATRLAPEQAAPAPSPAPKPLPARPVAPATWLTGLPAPQKIGRAPLVSLDAAPTPAEALAARPLRMDHKTHRKLTSGKLRPEARIDLHGMTLAQAQPALSRFITSCQINGLRLVLVITGKGSRGGDDVMEGRRGALRHQVPQWLHGGTMASIVQQVAPAHQRHGGGGAYYVYLRRAP
ncbi:MAG: Smr/MutS family protein [Paracoccus sp. (in: a-proteobacteria)]|nr:Smr/MutS family protein [Paracoccus sp. (in: a-proteobacteria)]